MKEYQKTVPLKYDKDEKNYSIVKQKIKNKKTVLQKRWKLMIPINFKKIENFFISNHMTRMLILKSIPV